MKYIRTKNSIYQVESVLRDNGFVKGYNVGEMAFIRKDQVIKQAETIEELCDEFVLINNNVFTVPQIITHTNFQNTKAYREDYGKFETIYGAIWTSKGLIYVAKMDSEGKLELI